jgi:hypothetical protein
MKRGHQGREDGRMKVRISRKDGRENSKEGRKEGRNEIAWKEGSQGRITRKEQKEGRKEGHLDDVAVLQRVDNERLQLVRGVSEAELAVFTPPPAKDGHHPPACTSPVWQRSPGGRKDGRKEEASKRNRHNHNKGRLEGWGDC